MRKYLAVGLVAIAALALIACGDQVTNVDIDQFIGTPSPAPPSPAPSTAPGTIPGAPFKVKTTQFGEACPVGLTPAPGDRDVRAGCSIDLTCTPTDAAGNDLGGQIPAPDSFQAISGADQLESVTVSGAYNRHVKAKTTGSGLAVFRCVVRGVPNETDFILGVVQ